MGHLAVCQRKGCFFLLSAFFNAAVVLSRTLIYMLTYNIDLGDKGRKNDLREGRKNGLTELTKFCKLTLDGENF